ncbi:MAG: hypothetical protein ACYTF6_14030 [Planctomycetota bacterium]
MSNDVQFLLCRICDLIAGKIDADRVATAKRRQAGVMAWREVDYVPLVFSSPNAFGAEKLPAFNWAERWYDPAKSLYMQLRDVYGFVAGGGDFVPGVRADTGVINCMSVFGVEYLVPEHTKPVVSKYVSKRQLWEFELPEDVSTLGVIPRMVEHMEHHLAVLRAHGLGELVSVYHCDQQGPFDVAAQTRGHEVFVDLYDDPEFVHDLMGKCARAYVAVSNLCKRINGEPAGAGNAVGVWMENGGVRMCGDSDILVSPEQFRQFIQPYQQEAFAHFGGGWLHYCGGCKGTGRREGLHLHELYAQEEGLRGLNWSTAGDWLREMRKLKDLGLVHIGSVPRDDGQDLEDYFRKALSGYDRRCGMIFRHPQLRRGEAERAMDVWHEVQDEVFGRG